MKTASSILCIAFVAFGAAKLAAQPASLISIRSETDWQNTTSVAISRTNPQIIAVSADDKMTEALGVPVYLTRDGGVSWNTHRLPLIFRWNPSILVDPAIAASDNGMFYGSYIANGYNSTSPFAPLCLFAASSKDGIHWKYAPTLSDTAHGGSGYEDFSPSIAVDNSPLSSHHGRVYLAWFHYDTSAAKIGIHIAWSDDHAQTWGGKVQITSGFGASSQVSVGRNGEVLIAFSDYSDRMQKLAVSTDGGGSFTFENISPFTPYPEKTNVGFVIKGGLPASAFTTLSVDASNRITAVYGTWKGWNSTDSSAALYYRTSDDLGQHWSDSVLVGSQSTEQRDRFFPWIATDPVTGATSIVYYSSELDSNNINTTVFRTSLGPEGQGLAEPLEKTLINPFSCTEDQQASVGDYIGCDAAGGVFAAAWTWSKAGVDSGIIVITPYTTGSSDVMIYVNSPNSGVTIPIKLNSDKLWLSDVFPNPAQPSVMPKVNFTLPKDDDVSLSIISETGATLKTIPLGEHTVGSYLETLDVSNLPAGRYYLRLSTASASVEKPLVIMFEP